MRKISRNICPCCVILAGQFISSAARDCRPIRLHLSYRKSTMFNSPPWRRRANAFSTFNMATILHLLTKPEDPLAEKIIAEQIRLPDQTVEVVDLAQRQLDYDTL